MFEQGTKHDQGKPRWSLIPLNTLEQVIKVLGFGAAKYSVGNWSHVPDARTRYYDAAMRHINAWWHGEKNDPDSGLPHLAHAVACLLFLMWFDDREPKRVSNAEYWAQQEAREKAQVEALADVMKRRGI